MTTWPQTVTVRFGQRRVSRGASSSKRPSETSPRYADGMQTSNHGSNAVQSLFKLSNIDDTSADLATAQDELNGILKMSVPGLVSESRRPFGKTSKDGKGQAEVSATGHILLAEPSVFNMGYLLRPSLAFVRRLGEIVPAGYGPLIFLRDCSN